MSLRLLAVGDIHLGRVPGGLPDALDSQHGLRPAALGPEAAWQATVDAAIARQVDAVLLLGDVVDSERHYLRSWSALESGVRRLVAADIEVVAVAGNHDVHVLPRLADTVTKLRLLGRGGAWEQWVLDRGERGAVALVGWSYPVSRPKLDPTLAPELTVCVRERPELPVLGMLHGELHQPGSRYAYFTRARLQASGATAWLLGHIHKPSFGPFAPGVVPVGYLGSLVGLDPSETGLHGPWLLTVTGKRIESAEQLALAPLRHERLEIGVEALSDASRLEDFVASALGELATREHDTLGDAKAVSVRIVLTGRHAQSRALHAIRSEGDWSDLAPTLNGRLFLIESVENRIRPAVDLAALARLDDPPGLLAQRLLALQGQSADPELLRQARTRLAELKQRKVFAQLAVQRDEDREAEPPEDPAALLLEAGLRVLEELQADSARRNAGASA